jgi:hypothetical protein
MNFKITGVAKFPRLVIRINLEANSHAQTTSCN